MKRVKSIFVIAVILIASIIVLSSFSFASQTISAKASLLSFNNAVVDPPKSANAPLNNDVWFAFTAIAVLGTYLTFKK